MALDPSVFGAFLRPARSAAEYAGDFADLDAKREAIANNALARSFSQAKLDEFNRQTSDANALRQFQRGLAGKSESDVIKAYRDAGYFTEAGALEKGALDRAKVAGDIQKEQVNAQKLFGEAQANSLKRFRGALDFIDTPEGAARWLQAQYADPLLVQHMQSLGPVEQAVTRIPRDPRGFAEWRQRAALGMEAHLKQQLEQDKATDAAAANLQQAYDSAANRAVTMRGQNMVDARAKESAAAAQFIPVDGVGLFYADKRTGTARPATDQSGAPIVPNKPLTEGQAKANLFGTRMGEADKILNDLAAHGVKAPSLPQQVTGGQGLSGMAATALATPQQQQVDQAQRDFINAVLRRESGAAIAPSEFENARRQYFVQPGDSQQVIAQKARNRQTAIAGMMAEVPESKRGVGGAAPSIPGLPSADAIAAELARRAKAGQ